MSVRTLLSRTVVLAGLLASFAATQVAVADEAPVTITELGMQATLPPEWTTSWSGSALILKHAPRDGITSNIYIKRSNKPKNISSSYIAAVAKDEFKALCKCKKIKFLNIPAVVRSVDGQRVTGYTVKQAYKGLILSQQLLFFAHGSSIYVALLTAPSPTATQDRADFKSLMQSWKWQ